MKGKARKSLIICLLVAYLHRHVDAYSAGAPDTTCASMEPIHDVTRQSSPSPYTVTPGAVQVGAGNRMEVILEAPPGDSFRGFLVQARSADEGKVIGTFFTSEHKYLNCNQGMNNAVTHKSGASESRVSLMWEAPSDFAGDVVFTSTFVRQRVTFWVGVTSEKVTVKRSADNAPSSATTTPAPAPTTAAPLTTDEFQKLQQDIVNIYDACGIGKGCFGIPTGCEKTGNCKILMTYTGVSGGYRFELMGKEGSGYYSTALSEDERMGGDSVMACRVLDDNVDVVMAQNIGKQNQLLSNTQLGLSQIRTAQIDGKVYCTFVRQTRTEIMDIVWDLQNNRYHVMVAMGPLSGSVLSYHSDREVSSGTVSLDKFQSIAATSKLFQVLHSALMVGAWVCAASCGIIIARYYKKTWLNSQCCGIDQWFHLHRFFMGLTWGMTIAGVVLIFYYVGGWTQIDPQTNPHAIIGIVSVGLCFIQPFMALCRCSPDHKNRPLFNWLHWMVGNAAQILGITAIFFGLELVGAPEWTTFILVIFIAFHCLVHLILSIGQCVSDSKAENGNNIYPMKEASGSRTPLNPTNKRIDAPGSGFRKAMLSFYLLINFLITAVLLLIVTVEEEQLKKWGLIFWE